MSESDDNVQMKVTNVFRNNVLKWVEIDDKIKKIRGTVKDLTNEKKQFEELILNYLSQVEEDSIVIKDGKLSKNVTKTKAPLKKESIYKALVELVGDATKSTSMTEHIINSRPDVQRIKLKRTQIRAKNN
jgi:hypothetical protein